MTGAKEEALTSVLEKEKRKKEKVQHIPTSTFQLFLFSLPVPRPTKHGRKEGVEEEGGSAPESILERPARRGAVSPAAAARPG